MKVAEDGRHFKVDISNYDELDSVFKKLGAVDCIVHLLPGRLDQQRFNY